MSTDVAPLHHHEEIAHHETDEQAASTVAVVSVVVLLFVAVCTIVVISFAQWWLERVIDERLQYPVPEVEALRSYESELLHGYTWVDRDKGLVRVPIEQGMEKVLETYGSGR